MAEIIETEICVIGGGLAGGLAACAFAHRGFSVALVDAQDPETLKDAGFDGRTTAISYASARLFQRLGVWDALEADAEAIRDILITDGRAKNRLQNGVISNFSLQFDSSELDGETPLGWIIENRHLRRAILDVIKQNPNIRMIAPAKRLSTVYQAGTAQTILDSEDEIHSALVIAADGRFSALRGEANIKINNWRYNQTGIVATVAHERPHQGVAHEFFLPSGPFAILPMTNDRSSLVWTERSDAAKAYLALDENGFAQEIQNRFGDHLGKVMPEGPRWSYPLAFHLAHEFVAPRLALIGDAARAIHPIAGQGYNLGVKDIAALTDVITEGRDVGLDIGAMTVLEKYQRWRRFDSVTLALGTDALNRLFSNDFAPLRAARDIGMGAVGRIAPLRKFFMRHAGADVGNLPSLMARETV
ncbi:MAG: UbiH/UbiF/VisC/COQ6 family ubiquinone biosynthesis hydroxylase [Marinicaulis sp.]|nr:UbiH/UbiF/VisC/COQ6 family ubiquinone biosynthesis hydroxylase [Marinicaulis sp.]NNL90210.1 UbiH/UbiF/VisC/COQ6 family ubiquinone biosynthesis hydroxylase [Marinicaulis sp.]